MKRTKAQNNGHAKGGNWSSKLKERGEKIRRSKPMRQILMALQLWSFATVTGLAATVTGNLTDISQAPVNTKILFSPTNEVLVTASGLNVGPAKVVDTTNGAFSVVLEAGNYTVSLPLIAARRPFCIYVLATNGTVNITNLLTGCPSTDSGLPLHVNAAEIVAWSTNGESSLIDTNITIPASTLHPASVVRIEAFGTFGDPANNSPNATFQLKLGSMVVLSVAKPATTANWHLQAAITFRSVGFFGVAMGSIALGQDNASLEPFSFGSQTATVDTMSPVTVSLTGKINDIAHTESVTCEQLVIRVE
jgi:hypothetical protein